MMSPQIPYTILRLREAPELCSRAAAWFHEKWGIPQSAYQESMEQCLRGIRASAPWPQWYLALDEEGSIAGGLGVIENDFHDRTDLFPNVCAVYVEPPHRGRGLAGALLEEVCLDMQQLGVSILYLITDHDHFYERYGWQFFSLAQGEGDPQPSRLYVHRQESIHR